MLGEGKGRLDVMAQPAGRRDAPGAVRVVDRPVPAEIRVIRDGLFICI